MPTPQNGGCWYCHGDKDLIFSTEFDTFVHEDCIKEAAEDSDDREAQIMYQELIAPTQKDINNV